MNWYDEPVTIHKFKLIQEITRHKDAQQETLLERKVKALINYMEHIPSPQAFSRWRRNY